MAKEDKYLNMARVLAQRPAALTPDQIALARKLVRKGAALSSIAEAVGWTAHKETLRYRLRQIGIRTHGGVRAHYGDEVTIPDIVSGCIDARPFVPKYKREGRK